MTILNDSDSFNVWLISDLRDKKTKQNQKNNIELANLCSAKAVWREGNPKSFLHLVFSSFDSIPYQESLSIGLTRSLKIIVQSFPSWRRKEFVSPNLKQNLFSCVLFSIAFLLFYFDDKYNWRLIIRNKIFPFSRTQSNSFI